MDKYERQELLEAIAGLIIIAGPFIALLIIVIISFF